MESILWIACEDQKRQEMYSAANSTLHIVYPQ